MRSRSVQPIARDPLAAAAKRLHQVGDLVSPGNQRIFGFVALRKEHPRLCDPEFVDPRQPLRLLHATLELEHDRRTVGEYQRVPHGVVQRPDLHVRAIECIANVARIIEQQRRTVRRRDPVTQPLQPIGPRPVQHRVRHRGSKRFVRTLDVQIGQLALVPESSQDTLP